MGSTKEAEIERQSLELEKENPLKFRKISECFIFHENLWVTFEGNPPYSYFLNPKELIGLEILCEPKLKRTRTYIEIKK